MTAISATVIFSVKFADKRAISLVNIGTKMATPNGAAISLKSPYIPVPVPAVSAGRLERTIFINIAAFAPSPKPKIPREAASKTSPVVLENKSIVPQPMPVKSREQVKMYLGSKRSAKGPKRMAPRDIPTYIIEIAYPEMAVFVGCV